MASVEQLPSAKDSKTPPRRKKTSGEDKTSSRKARPKSIPSSDLSSSSTPNGTADQQSKESRFLERRKPAFFLGRCKHAVTKHSWIIPLILMLAVLSAYAYNPTESNVVHRFIFLSYAHEPLEGADPSAPTQYGKGLWDIAFVSFYTIVLSFTRKFTMQELLRPLARFCGINSRGKQYCFMEQVYTAIYFSFIGSAGLYVMSGTPVWYFNTHGMYDFFPHKTHLAIFKFYYLFQAAYWSQQAIVMLLGLEKPRKDFYELVAHHIITLTLISLSYRFHFTYIGLVVYITHDISDFFLAASYIGFLSIPYALRELSRVVLMKCMQLSKSLHYIGCPVVELYFGTSIVSWIYFRHYQNLRLIYSLCTEFETVGTYELNWETQQYKCTLSFVIALGLLFMLQSINIFWLYCLLRSAYRFLVHNIVKDDRSEVEESELEELERKKAR
jgi:acyl-CoA-dependent ceramide synthase